ncbi:hypothetical protein ACFX2C_022235 [Malus domestica]
MSSFPPELVVDILSWLAPEDLIRCMHVCKAWNAFIRGENFIKSHLQRSIQTNSTRFILLTSSDLVLFSLPFGGKETFGSANGGFALWNPFIRKLKKIPRSTLEPLPPLVSGHSALYGFGYDSANADYNLVGVIEFYNSKNVIEYGVAESWTFLFSVEMEVLPMGFDLLCKLLAFLENGDMVLLTNDNGGIYWYDLEGKSFKRVEIHGEPSTYTATVCVGSLCLPDGDSVVAKRQ